MNKVKVRCSVCGKPFKTPSAKKTVCPSCDAIAKRAKHLGPAKPATPQPAIVSPTVDVRAAVRAAQENQGQFGAYRPAPPPAAPAPAETSTETTASHAHGRQPGQPATTSRPERPPRPKAPRTAEKQQAPRPPKERKPRVQMKPFEPSEEQIATIRTRYLELAQPEFDGIRHRIADELGIPLRAVKAAIKQVRAEQQIPSWWDRGATLPTPEQVEQIRVLYLPLLPEPAVGVHKQIAAQLQLSNTCVYQAIGQIRSELNLPRYTARAEDEEKEPLAQDSSDDAHEELQLPRASGE